MIAWMNRMADRLEAFNAKVRWRNEIRCELISIRADEEIARIREAEKRIFRRRAEAKVAKGIAEGTMIRKPDGSIEVLW